MKKVLITGGTRGLGKAISMLFAKEGYKLYLNYYADDDAAFSLKKDLETLYHSDVTLLKGDIASEKFVDELFLKVGLVDVLICNAGIDNVCDIECKTYASFKRVMDVNLFANYLLTFKFGMAMEKHGSGVIIYINSDNVIDKNDPVSLEYDISKAGLLMLANDFAKYFENVFIHTIAPGWMDTNMNDIPLCLKDEFKFVSCDEVALLVLKQVSSLKSGNVEVIR